MLKQEAILRITSMLINCLEYINKYSEYLSVAMLSFS